MVSHSGPTIPFFKISQGWLSLVYCHLNIHTNVAKHFSNFNIILNQSAPQRNFETMKMLLTGSYETSLYPFFSLAEMYLKPSELIIFLSHGVILFFFPARFLSSPPTHPRTQTHTLIAGCQKPHKK